METGVVVLPQKGNTNMTTLKVSFSSRNLISIHIEDSFTMGLNLIPNDPDTVFHAKSLFNWLLLPNMTDIDWWQMANSTNKMSGWCFVRRIHEPSPSHKQGGFRDPLSLHSSHHCVLLLSSFCASSPKINMEPTKLAGSSHLLQVLRYFLGFQSSSQLVFLKSPTSPGQSRSGPGTQFMLSRRPLYTH